MKPSGLPIDEALPRLSQAFADRSNAVLVAPPGAGKTTVVPLALLEELWCTGKVIVLEPRRIAARGAARRMAQTLGERVGETVGLRVRLETLVSDATQIEVVTEGVFTRTILADPGLEGISAVLLDEFHERSLDADLALALALDAQALRPDLRLLPMSATLDGARVAALIEAETVASEGRAFPVAIEYRERLPRQPIEDAVARAVRVALAEHSGSVLAFLPGQREIERTVRQLAGIDAELHPLHGQLGPGEQDAAIRAAAKGTRKVVLATAIAETSITIDGVTTVVDGGLARRPRFDPATGLTRLETVRVSRAAAEQRAGRAGRTAPGQAVRLWREEQTGALDAFDPPEILHADLSGLVLDLADWGVSDPSTLRWLDPPPAPAWKEAVALLERLGALTEGRPTEHGRELASRPLPPRLAHMTAMAPDPVRAATLAFLLEERGLGGDDIDLAARLDNFARDRSSRAKGVRSLVRRAADGLRMTGNETVGATLARGFFDRVAMRGGVVEGRQRFKLANGRGAEIAADHPLAREPFLVVAEMGGANGRVFSAAPISREEIEAVLNGDIRTVREASYDVSANRVTARERDMLGALILAERSAAPEPDEAREAILAGLRRHGLAGLPWPKARARLGHLDPSALDDDVLVAELEDWLAPYLTGATVDPEALASALLARSGHDARSLERALPSHYELPTGERRALVYEAGRIELHARPQELFGLDLHPTLLDGRLPLTLVLLSPARRPIQTTDDLAAFWRGSWIDVAKEMRGRYPKHPWPDRPWEERPTNRTKKAMR